MFNSKLVRNIFFIFVILIAIILSSMNILGGYFYKNGPLGETKIVILEKGLSIHEIAEKLHREGVIEYPQLFEIIAAIYSHAIILKSGEYKFTPGATPAQIFKKLSKGKSLIHKLFIPEGLMTKQILEIISEEDRLAGIINENIPEGYLLPSTYHYSYGDKREKITDMMRKEMSAAIDEAMAQLKPNSPLKSRQDVLILASIIEKEAGNDAERPMIAGVFINRLNKGMRLQADPTVAYAITEGQSKLGRSLTRADLRMDSPYNTYIIYGLPKGPICCPGKESIMAAVNPATTKALYFVVDGSGGHAFSNTLTEHNMHVQNYRVKAGKASNQVSNAK